MIKRENVKAVIITIGDEILIGQTIDTNAAWIGEKLNQLGIQVEKNISIRDEGDAIHRALDEAWQQASLVIMTGGLGPTRDDITKESLADYFDTRLVHSERVYRQVEKFVARRAYSMNDNNAGQAMVPEACEVIDNPLGTAPVMKFTRGNDVLYSMPGVPFEMEEIMEKEVLPRIKQRYHLPSVKHETLMTYGLPEAILAEKLNGWENRLPEAIKLAYLPSPRGIKIRLSVYHKAEAWKNELDKAISELHRIIPGHIFSDKEQSLENVLLSNLKRQKLSIATAESCTGGLLASLLTSVPGASDVFQGSIVAYQNNMKSKLLDVPEKIIKKYGAVSKEVVMHMAKGVIEKLTADTAIAVSGIAGPTGGSEDKPVGTTWIAIATPDGILAEKFLFGSTREVNTLRAAYTGMHMLNNRVR
ncbi:MAG: CinA family nicotinamide mononucleotide deamidase-related protein [Bacteroidota bacterium]